MISLTTIATMKIPKTKMRVKEKESQIKEMKTHRKEKMM